tara:strand:- start:34 stop:156 length:123 start_codon:yes stop_codon:yes gene_type:complete
MKIKKTTTNSDNFLNSIFENIFLLIFVKKIIDNKKENITK